ncbi:MAG: hypothetical protein HFF68_09065 [Oscillospiraceae bacterium]|nr:hypothetical protein [Oscillospiraceae bacterium]
MKRYFSLFLSALLLLTLGTPALAAEAKTDQRLAQAAAMAKKSLGIGDDYETFHGELWENELAPVWSMNWEREEDSIHVTATGSGKVLSYSLSENTGSTAGTFPPAFPALTPEQARARGEAFLKKVLEAPLETAVFSEDSYSRLDSGTCRFSGRILLGGLPSPLSFSLTVRSSDGAVIRFSRDSLEGSVIGGVPSASPAAGQESAGGLLRDTLALRLEYVLDEEGKTASLRYLPEAGDDYFVDAQTGKLVNLSELYAQAQKRAQNSAGGLAESAADDAAPAAAQETGAGLTQAELEGVAKLEGVLSKDALDKEVRETAALGLGKYTLASASYSLNQESGDVTARLAYTRKDGNGVWRRNVTCDARSAALLSVSSYAPYTEKRTASIGEDEARKTAEAFLGALWGEEFAASRLYRAEPWEEKTSYGAAHAFTYAQQENGYFCPENSLSVAVDITDGSISALDRQWTAGVRFDSAEGLLDEAAAMGAWFDHYDVALGYRNIPVKLDLSREDPLAASLMEMGYEYFYSLKLAYTLEEPEGRSAAGVDAKSGKVIFRKSGGEESALSYSDLEGSWARKQLETLAGYGIGWSGGVCRPKKELTQIDLLTLLVSADGYRYDPETGSADDLYRRAYQLGILTPAARQDQKRLTRGETVRLLLDCAGFGSTAKLQGIFTCSYTDREQIPADLLGYAALAQGLGIVGKDGSFDAGRTATRTEAAVMLYNFMNR